MKARLILTALLLALAAAQSATAQNITGADPRLADQGRYLATAGDCAGCHGEALSGGKAIASPVGAITASNITPDNATGIGRWTLHQFSDALRKGKAPGGYLYPTMPYTSYTGLSDIQVRALYSYLKLRVKPVSHNVVKTELPFPFLRPMMALWDMAFLDQGHSVGAIAVQGEKAKRGRLLVETLGHCAACHTPRGVMMQQKASKHLGGAMVDGWWAPNLTPGKGGLGMWSDAELETFLATGHTARAVAAGEMGTVVSHSLSKLKPADIAAIVAYLRKVPPVDTPVPATTETGPVQPAVVEPNGPQGGQAMLTHDTKNGGLLYQSTCAACHGFDGNGSPGAVRPSLRDVDAVTAPQGATLVQVIAHGVNRQVGGHKTIMPGYAGAMSNAQIAALANYVRTQFGGVASNLTAADVARIRSGQTDEPWLILNATWLAIAGIALGLLLLAFATWLIVRATQRHRRRHA